MGTGSGVCVGGGGGWGCTQYMHLAGISPQSSQDPCHPGVTPTCGANVETERRLKKSLRWNNLRKSTENNNDSNKHDFIYRYIYIYVLFAIPCRAII